MTAITWITAVAVASLTLLGSFVRKAYVHRAKINTMRKQGVPMPEGWSWFTGHLLTLQKYVENLPPDANVNLAMAELAREHSDTEIFLMDFWPVYPPLLMVYDPDAAVQVTTTYNLPKTSMHLQFMKPITGGPNLISMSDQEWKVWRSRFNPGFSTAAMMDSVPHIIKSVQIFQEKLRKASKEGILCLDDFTTRLTMDVIMKLTLDADINYQLSESAIITALGHITRWHSFWDPRVLLNPLRPFVQRYYGRVMDTLIRKELEQRFVELKKEVSHSKDLRTEKRPGANSVITLAIESYMAENKHTDFIEKPKLDEDFARYATYQIRLFLFAGSDTTSSTIVYVYHLLSRHPEALEKVRQEHDAIFGSEIGQAADLLTNSPTLLNQCKFTLAVIKETLRLYPPAATMRAGRPGVTITDRHGGRYSMDYVGTTVLHPAVHKNPRVWPQPNEFLPERFMVDPGHELYPYSPAYRPFEQGPRNCIGQTLVWNEILITLILTLRVFDITPAYDEWDAARNSGFLQTLKGKTFGEPIKTVNGDRAYQTEKAGTHPADGYPCRVSISKRP